MKILLIKSWVKPHSRRLKDGRLIDVAGHYDRRTRKVAASGSQAEFDPAGGGKRNDSHPAATVTPREDPRLLALLKLYAGDSELAPAEIAEAVRQYHEVERQNAQALRAHDTEGRPLPAPNGQPSNLNREQWVLVRTLNFRRWFGDSKAVDANGEPLVVYHGTMSGKDFSEIKAGPGDIGVHVGSLSQAEQRMQDVYQKEFGGNNGFALGSRVLPLFVSLKNPLLVADVGQFNDAVNLWNDWNVSGEFNDDGETYSKIESLVEKADNSRGAYFGPRDFSAGRENKAAMAEIKRALVDKGYDGLTYTNSIEGELFERTAFVLFEPAQIKSAIGNAGTFRPDLGHLNKSCASPPRRMLFFRR